MQTRQILVIPLGLALALTAAGCGGGGDDYPVHAEAIVRGDAVLVSVGVEVGSETTFAVNGVEHTSNENWVDFVFPLADLEPGETTWRATATQDGKTQTAEVSFVVPEKAQTVPFFHVLGCASGPGANASLEGKWASRRVFRCAIDEDGALSLSYAGTEGATVTLGGATLTLEGSAAGRPGVLRADLLDLVRTLPPETLSRPGPLSVPVAVESDAGIARSTLSLEHTLLVSDVGTRLRAVEKGKPLAWAKPPQPGEALAAVVTNNHNQHLRIVGQAGPLETVDVVAVALEQEPRELGECGPYTDLVRDENKGMVPHEAVDTEVTVYTAHDAREIARTTLRATERPCPQTIRVMRVTDSVGADQVDAFVSAQLDALAATE